MDLYRLVLIHSPPGLRGRSAPSTEFDLEAAAAHMAASILLAIT